MTLKFRLFLLSGPTLLLALTGFPATAQTAAIASSLNSAPVRPAARQTRNPSPPVRGKVP